jgi:hypothetical protein
MFNIKEEHMRLLWVFSSFLYALLLPQLCMAQSYQPPFPWPQTLEEAKELKLSNANVSAIMNDGRTEPDPTQGSFSVVDGFTFAQLERGKMYLVAVTDASGRDFFNYLQLRYCGSATCTDAVVDAVPPHNLSEEVTDLDGDGVDEIVAKNWAGGYEGAATESIYTYMIYKIIDGKPVDVSDRYKSYYESTLLPRMKANITVLRAQAVGHAEELERIDALDTAAQDDYQRRILKNSRAGLDHAKAWIHSDNERLRDYAVQTFTAISDPEVEQILTQMKADPNAATAKAASWALESWRAMKYQRGAGPSK